MSIYYVPDTILKIYRLFLSHQSLEQSLFENNIYALSVQFSSLVMSDYLRPHELQHARPPCLSPTPGVHSNSRPLSWWCYPAISSSVVPFSSCPQSLQASGSFQSVSSLHEVAKVLEFQLQHHSFQRNPRADLLQNGLVGSPCSPKDSQESSPTPQFKSINSSGLSLLHSPTLTSIHLKTSKQMILMIILYIFYVPG